jgi:hypothetical protein
LVAELGVETRGGMAEKHVAGIRLISSHVLTDD